jgi:hypothetical protein
MEVIHMRIWRNILESAKRSPRGYLADGRRLGLGLAVAMDKARQNAAAEAEDYLRTQADSPVPARG